MNEEMHRVDVDGIGQFQFRHRTMKCEFRIGIEYSKLTGGIEKPTPWLNNFATMVSELTALTVTAPEGWDIDAMDPLDENTFKKIAKVHKALRTEEDSFRNPDRADSEGQGQGDSGDSGPMVSKDVSSAA